MIYITDETFVLCLLDPIFLVVNTTTFTNFVNDRTTVKRFPQHLFLSAQS